MLVQQRGSVRCRDALFDSNLDVSRDDQLWMVHGRRVVIVAAGAEQEAPTTTGKSRWRVQRGISTR
jgi:GMP synthase-like glutamine amidotransferase